MTKAEYLSNLSKVKIDNTKVDQIQKIYGRPLPEIIKEIISYSDEAVFFEDDSRMISFEEMLDAEQDLHVDFKSKGIIPVTDCGENDFIVYHLEDGSWSKFNIVDESIFKKRKTLCELLK